jgi:signal transduction histidine kinase
MMQLEKRRLEVTLVTCYRAAMNETGGSGTWRLGLRGIDPRRSLVAGAMWLIVGLAITFSISAGLWVGSIARHNVLEQHVRRLSLETDQLSSELGQALASRLDAIEAAGRILRAPAGDRPAGMTEMFNELTAAYPELDWVAAAGSDGIVRAASGSLRRGSDVNPAQWFEGGLKGPWLGVIADGPRRANSAGLGDMAAPVKDGTGQVIGVIAAHLSWRRSPHHPERLTDESDPRIAAQAYVLDRDETVLVGPEEIRGRRWNGVPLDARNGADPADAPQFERLPDGRRVLVSREPLSAGSRISALGWEAQLSEPRERVYQRANALAAEILWVSMCLAVVTCLLGALGARQLTGRLKRLTESVAALGQNAAERIDIPGGVDEVARLARAFARILGDLQQERRELQTLSSELERRVAVRTREVERLAEESRYAAIVRERLKIARDLHDTLAHSMMALLSEIRFLRRLQARDPAAVADELARAEEVAHEGLKEARSAITQMRVNAVRETGLGPALANEFERFVNRTGLSGEFSADPVAARFGDERAETILRMAQEVLRNVERHSMATRVAAKLQAIEGDRLELRIEDNGVGFDTLAERPGHFGLTGLREQADLIGAQLRIESTAQCGTAITVTLRTAPAAFVV